MSRSHVQLALLLGDYAAALSRAYNVEAREFAICVNGTPQGTITTRVVSAYWTL